MVARRTRHWRSSASSAIAGRSDCASRSTPTTALSACRVAIRLRRTWLGLELGLGLANPNLTLTLTPNP